ncbi:MAG TPA: PVC-type heme-binding CxxCH protein [Verrucomicrobiae bacterium]
MKIPTSVSALAIALASALTLNAAAPDLFTFQIDPRLEISLFASEPDVIDPVALCFDEGGRMYVVEMRDYPYGIGPEKKPGGTIRLLEDTDADGKADKSTIFARDLSFPTSIAPWNGGVFVTAPPDILFLKDTNNDGVADVREVYFTGFVLAVTDSNANGLRWGPDNRLHGLNGGNGGLISSPKKPQLSVELGNADFSFNPRNWDLTGTYQSSGGFGLVFDEFGASFVTHNINHLQQRILPLPQLYRFPGMFPVDATRSISDHGNMARIFPISVAQTRPNHPEQAGHFSSSGGLGYIGYDAWPEDLHGSVTVGDVVGNLVHRDTLQTNGSIFLAKRSPSESDREFISSRDPAARFTGLELGPDGALYLIDMQRDVIEHPDYIPEKMRNKQDIRAGDDRGRIYRLAPKSGLPKETVDLSKASPQRLVAELEHHNMWRRQTAHRLLLEREAKTALPQLRTLVTRSKYAPARVHALWTITALEPQQSYSHVETALRDPDPGVRLNAVRIAETLQPQPWQQPGQGIDGRLRRLVNDPSPAVRLQLALSLGNFDQTTVEPALIDLLAKNSDDQWIRTAALSSLRNAGAAFPKVLERLQTNTPAAAEVVRDLADLAISRVDHPAAQVVEVITALDNTSDDLIRAGLEGMDRALSRKQITPSRLSIQPILSRLAKRNDDLFVATWRVSKRLGLVDTAEQSAALEVAKKSAANNSTPRAERLRGLERLRFGSYTDVRDAIFANLTESADPELQSAAVNVLRNFRDEDIAERLVQRWPVLAPSLRTTVLNFLLSRRNFHNALVTGVENGDLKLGELNLDLEQRRTLLRESSDDIKTRAAKFIGDEEYSNRKTVLDDWLAKLPATGDPAAGRPVFEQLCAQCHRAADLGKNVGPDLTSIAHRSVEDLLYNIIDPSMAINPAYLNYQVETKSGDLINGILVANTADSVTLLQANEIKTTIPRADIAKLRSTGTSLMPESLESTLTPQQMRDLIAFLQSSTGK